MPITLNLDDVTAAPTDEQLELVRERIGQAIAARMAEGLTLAQATAEAFAYCDARWPVVTAAVLAYARRVAA